VQDAHKNSAVVTSYFPNWLVFWLLASISTSNNDAVGIVDFSEAASQHPTTSAGSHVRDSLNI